MGMHVGVIIMVHVIFKMTKVQFKTCKKKFVVFSKLRDFRPIR